jgi:hypothetical protein
MDNTAEIPVPRPKPWVLDETINDVTTSALHAFFGRYKKTTLWLLCGSAVWVILLTLAGGNQHGFLSFLRLLPIAVVFGFGFWVYNKTRHEFYRQFAAANNMSYLQSGAVSGLAGALFNLGHGRTSEDIIGGSYDGNNFTMFTYRYTIGSGKSQQTYNCTVAQIDYPSILPPILLVVDNQYFGGIVPLFSGWQKIKPEGNFDKTFDLYSKKEFEIEALQIFTPDVMQNLLTDFRQFNLEFNDNILYVFCAHTITTKVELQKMYEFMRYLITKIEPVAIRMKSSLQAMEAMRS